MQKLLALLLVTAGSFSFAATPSEGIPLKVRRGFFTDLGMGGFFTVAGDNGNSNLQLYLQLGAGYQLTVNDGMGIIPIGAHVAIGANAQNCYSGLRADNTCQLSDNFTLIFVDASAGYLHQVYNRVYLGGKVVGGWTVVNPEPNTGVTGGPNIGLLAAVEYATNMDHFSVGLDMGSRMVLNVRDSAGVPLIGLMIFARVQYTF
jgi:hypothetical protein